MVVEKVWRMTTTIKHHGPMYIFAYDNGLILMVSSDLAVLEATRPLDIDKVIKKPTAKTLALAKKAGLQYLKEKI